MKKLNGLWLLLVACIFASGMIGFYIGRNSGRSAVDISGLSLSVSDATQNTESLAASESSEAVGSTGPININTADSAQLQTLPGIGPTLAQRIIDYRQTHGSFQSVYDLTEVSGIGLTKLENILDYITVGGEE